MDSTWNIRMLHYLFLVLLVAQHCVMEGDFEGPTDPVSSSKSSLSLGEQQQVPFHTTVEPIEIVGPRDFQALSGDLIVWTRLSPLVFNLSGRFDEESGATLDIQLTLLRLRGDLQILQTLPAILSTTWTKVTFECNLVVQGGQYLVRVVRSGDEESLSNVTISIKYPTIVFEVPHRIEAYTTETPVTFGLTRSTSCEPKLPLPSTVLTLSVCTPPHTKTKTETNDEAYPDDEDIECNKDFASIFDNPLQALQKEGRITTSVECHLWARNSTFRVQLREEGTKSVIAKSRPIRVEWGSQFSINVSKATVMPCRNSVRAVVGYPGCVLPGRDKIRVFGHETLSVPSLLVPSRLSYIGEQQIRPNNRVVTFRCNLFAQRFLRFCFQYINTAVDDSVAVVVEKCIPTNPPLRLSDGGWGPWSSWTPCTVSCGSDGKQYRYRFCDNPPPSSGANFCQGEAIDERRCDNTMPECPGVNSVVYIDGESLSPPQVTQLSPEIPPFDVHQLPPANITQGCECGCILYDLVPNRNDTLVIFISSNHSSPCADEDEVDHHKLKWILQAKEEKDRVRLEILEMDLQCVTITFRDGNTTDSNLLQMITSHEVGEEQVHYYDGQWRRLREEVNLYGNVALESTGASLSIASASDTNKNCSGQFIYFIAYYSTLTTSTNSSFPLQEPVGTAAVASLVPYETWTFLILKFILLFFVVVVVLSGFGGCLTKIYRKEKYKELQCFENEDEGGSVVGGGGESSGGLEDDSSRCTSVTLMSFDYTYWRRLRILRLKYFLLRPRPLEYLSTRVKSFPTTPTHSRVLVKKKVGGTKGGRSKDAEGPSSSKNARQNPPQKSSSETCQLVRSASLSERNLRVKEGEKKDEKRRSKRYAGVSSPEDPREEGGEMTTRGNEDGMKIGVEDGGKRMTRTIYCMDPLGSGVRVMRTATTLRDTSSVSISLNGSDSRSSTSTPTNESTSTLSEKGGGVRRQSEKLLKEQENEKRRASSEGVDLKKDAVSSSRRRGGRGAKKEGVLVEATNNKFRGQGDGRLTKKDIGKSNLSVSTTQGSVRCSEDSESRGPSRAGREDADHDFEMDYYDYDVMNVGTIPGSYLGLEPAFVLWNSEVYPGVDEEEQRGQDDLNLMIPCGSGSSAGGTSSHEEDDGMEMTATTKSATSTTTSHSGYSGSTSLGIFSDLHHSTRSGGGSRGGKKNPKEQSTVKETSLDTLKFADEDSDDNATLDSDSIFDNEADLINDPHHNDVTSCS